MKGRIVTISDFGHKVIVTISDKDCNEIGKTERQMAARFVRMAVVSSPDRHPRQQPNKIDPSIHLLD